MKTRRRAASGGTSLTPDHRDPQRRMRVLVASGILAGSVLIGTGSAPAATGSFDGSASATGARMIFFADKAPATKTPIDGGGPVAQAVLDSLGTSNALASNPYPGDLFLAGPGLAAGAFGVPSLPGYPFIARAEHPAAPEQATSTPFGDFAASATSTAAKATATTGGGSGDNVIGRAVSNAGVRADGDLVISEAQSTAQAIRIGDLRIGSVRSQAKVVLKPDGTLERTAEVAFDDAAVAGVPVVFTADGVIPAEGMEPPLGVTPADQLEDSGIQVVQLNREDTPDGVIAGGLQITKVQDFGPGGPGYIRFVFGQATARARGEATELAAPADPTAAEPTTDGSASTTVAQPGTASSSSSLGDTNPGPSDATMFVNLGEPSPDPLFGPLPVAAAPASDFTTTGSTVTGSAALGSSSEQEQAVGLQIRPARLAVSDANRLDAGPIYTVLLLAAVIGGTAMQIVRVAGR